VGLTRNEYNKEVTMQVGPFVYVECVKIIVIVARIIVIIFIIVITLGSLNAPVMFLTPPTRG
jgi:hypothetical protein